MESDGEEEEEVEVDWDLPEITDNELPVDESSFLRGGATESGPTCQGPSVAESSKAGRIQEAVSSPPGPARKTKADKETTSSLHGPVKETKPTHTG